MPLEDLKAYVNYIETIKNTNPEDEVSGIRLYFSAYPNKSQLYDRDIKYPGQQTIFMVPTVKSDMRNERNPTMNHLPFAIKPYSTENPIKGSFIILEKLMLEYYKSQERVRHYYENSKQNRKNTTTGSQVTTGSTSGFSARSGSRANNTGLTSTAYNEFQQAPPPKKGDNN